MGNGRQFGGRGFYEIRVKGKLDLIWADWFDGFSITSVGDEDTLLAGSVVDLDHPRPSESLDADRTRDLRCAPAAADHEIGPGRIQRIRAPAVESEWLRPKAVYE